MAAVGRKKQDDKYLQVLRELITNGGGNRQCFDCGQKGPTYVNMTIGSFVCTRCSGVLRGLTPPHRVKSISMATFTQDEVDFLKAHGNDDCAKTWLGLWDPKRVVHQDQRELMIDKYERKRYYLEPASPLKSLANAVSLKSGSATTATSATTVAAAAAAPSLNGNGDGQGEPADNVNNNKNQLRQQNINVERSFHLTPPSTQRTTMNGLHKTDTGTTASSVAGKGTLAISRPQQNGYSHLQDMFMQKCRNNNYSGNNTNNVKVLHMTPSRISESSSSASNDFGADSDFVADFGSANIFDATMTAHHQMNVTSTLNGRVAAISSNGYARILPLQNPQQQQHQLLNGHTNGYGPQYGSSCGNGNTENFADFEHAPIFNAAGLPVPTSMHPNSRTIINMHNNNQNNNNNNNNTLSSTPSEDRYAALKDLDEQLRETKAAAVNAAAYGVDNFGSNGHGNGVNPFKHQQPNPFQAATNDTSPTTTQSLFGQMAVIPNGNGMSTQPAATTPLYNYSNGFGNGTTTSGTVTSIVPSTVMAVAPNGCGFGLGTLQPTAIAAGGGGGGAFNNPFAATGAMSSNNPFL